ncbi:thioredoxin 1 [Fusarium austroafricanum]|uniref:Thioredoxin n=1 Tax=Fusarium austroafricanum TaxID=2364996 RepID=A0A8H4KSL4_9HYPO|nr:thioredoxin 1 [Fusarium austroafricanum]
MGLIEIQKKTEFDDLLKSHQFVLVDASASWCGPCKAISPFFEKHAAENDHLSDKVAFLKFDTDDVPDLAQELGIRSIPTFFLFEGGELVDSLSGANPPRLQQLCQTAVAKAQGS